MFLLWTMFTHTSKELDSLEEKNESLKTEVTELKQKVATFEEAAKEADEQYKDAEKRRLEVIAKMAGQIGKIRDQTPPKECEKAVDWAIQNKGDLKWPQK